MRDTLRRGISQLFISPIHKTYIQLFLLIKLITTFTITSFSSVRLSAIINVSATSILLPINFEPSDLYSIPFFSRKRQLFVFDDVRKKTYGALQVCHLRLCQPHRLILQLHINGSFPILCLINDNLSSIVD